MKASRWTWIVPALIAPAYLGACGNTEARPVQGGSVAAVGAAGGAARPDAHGAAGNAATPAPPQGGVAQEKGFDHAPEVIRGIYLNAYVGHRKLHELLGLADRTEINTFVVDVKDERGPHYDSRIPQVRQLTSPGWNTWRNLKTLTDTLHAHKLYAIARIVVFKDSILSKAHPDWSIRRPGGELWRDKTGMTWVSAWDRDVWNYNIEIAEEAAKAGFDEIQFDYVRFPEPFKSLPRQVHLEAKGTRTDAIVGFLNEAVQRLHPLGVPVAADVFGLSPADGDDIQIGQQWERIVTAADHVLPMVYPSHFLPTHLPHDPHPNRAPGETVYKALGLGDIRVGLLQKAGVARVARVIPWLQGFSAPWVDRTFTYGPEQAKEQIDAVYRTGHEDWIFWHPGAKYELIEAAFAPKPAARHAQKFEPTPELVGYEKVLEGRGAAAARAQVARAAAR